MSVEFLPIFPISVIGGDGTPNGWIDQVGSAFIAFDETGEERGRMVRLSVCNFAFEAAMSPSDEAEAREAIGYAKKKFETLTTFGFGVYPGQPFDRSRNNFSHARVSTAIKFLRQIRQIQKVWLGSYGLKHRIGRWGEANQMAPYCSNGEGLVAALWLGFTVSRSGTGPNAWINASLRDLRRLDSEARLKASQMQWRR